MINVNLLPISTFKQKLRGRIFLTALALLIVIGGAGIFSAKTFVFDARVAQMKTRSSQLQTELQRIKNQVTEANTKTEATVRKWKQLAAIMDLEERRRDQTRLLTEVEKLVPKGNAWLVSLDHKKGQMVLKGVSKDKDTIGEFLNKLQNASYLDKSSVYLGEISQNMRLNGMLLTTFTITGHTKFPQPEILDEGMPDFNLPSTTQFGELVKSAAPSLAAGILPGEPQTNNKGARGR